MSPKNQQELAIATLQVVQQILGQLGFTLTADRGYYKDYGLTDGSVARLIPIFDKGISLDMSYRLTGFDIITSKRIHFVEGLPAPVEEFPFEMSDDVKSLIAGLAPASKPPLSESFMVTAECAQCGKDVESFVHIGNQYTCLQCLGIKDV